MNVILKAFCPACNIELKYTGWQKPINPPLEIHFCPNCKLEYWISDNEYPQTVTCQPSREMLVSLMHEKGAQLLEEESNEN